MTPATAPAILGSAAGGLRRLSDLLDLVSKRICIVLVLLIVSEVMVHVIFRYLFFAPLAWGEELARVLMIWTGMLGIAIALRDGEHMGLDTLLDRVGPRPRAALRLGGQFLVSLFLFTLLYWGTVMALRAWGSVLPALQISWTWAMLAVPVTAAVQLVHIFRAMLDEVLVLLGADSGAGSDAGPDAPGAPRASEASADSGGGAS